MMGTAEWLQRKADRAARVKRTREHYAQVLADANQQLAEALAQLTQQEDKS